MQGGFEVLTREINKARVNAFVDGVFLFWS